MHPWPSHFSQVRIGLTGIATPLLAALLLAAQPAAAGGPRWVAGPAYFAPSTLGQPIVWKGGVVPYYTDLGPLSPTVTQAQANAMVAAAAALWSGVPTAALRIGAAGSLAEDVSGANFFVGTDGLTMPADVESSATATPLGIIYDADGSVLDALEGEGASDPDSCVTNGVTTVVDNFAIDATIAHALIIVNGLCATDLAHVALVQYELLRGFGRILGLDWSQANDQMFPANITLAGLLGWPLMHPVEKLCNSNGNPCMTGTIAPRLDDVAALSRLYPVTFENIKDFDGKSVTATVTISISGTVSFRTGQGMQGVNVVARPLVPGTGLPDFRYPASAVTGAFFTGNLGNLIGGFTDNLGFRLDRFGTDTVTEEGHYNLSGIPLPPGMAQADYQVTFEPVNPLYINGDSVGPYALGQVVPSGTMPIAILHGLTAGSAIVLNETNPDSAGDANSGDDGSEESPEVVPVTGQWEGRLSGYGHDAWLRLHVRAGRQATVEAQPLNEQGLESEAKARIELGVWNADEPPGTSPQVGTPQPFNGVPTGLTTMSFETGGDGGVRLELADQRGDGRPDYLYRGRVLYADSVTPLAIPTTGGAIIIRGMGFRPGNTVTVGGFAAAVTSLSATEIVATAPAAAGAEGNVTVTVTDPVTQGLTEIEAGSIGGLSYSSRPRRRIRVPAAPVDARRADSEAIEAEGLFQMQGTAQETTANAGPNATATVTNSAAAQGAPSPIGLRSRTSSPFQGSKSHRRAPSVASRPRSIGSTPSRNPPATTWSAPP